MRASFRQEEAPPCRSTKALRSLLMWPPGWTLASCSSSACVRMMHSSSFSMKKSLNCCRSCRQPGQPRMSAP